MRPPISRSRRSIAAGPCSASCWSRRSRPISLWRSARGGSRASFWPALIGALCLVATLAVFFLWTYPANRDTANWTAVPDNWAALRLQWEYSHAGNALLTFIALALVTLSVLRWRPG